MTTERQERCGGKPGEPGIVSALSIAGGSRRCPGCPDCLPETSPDRGVARHDQQISTPVTSSPEPSDGRAEAREVPGGESGVPADPVKMEQWLGHEQRQCGEHRPLGAERAYCYECSEKCSELGPCMGCELPVLRHELADAKARAEAAEAKVSRIRHLAAEPFTPATTLNRIEVALSTPEAEEGS